MPLDDEMRARLDRVGQEVLAICKRERVAFVLVMEPIDEDTGIFIATDESLCSEQAAVKHAREMLKVAAERIGLGKFNVVET